MKKTLFILALAGGFLSAHAQDELINKVKDNGGEDGYVFETLINLDATEVKNQGSSGTCWSYCTTSFIESEMIRQGKEPVDIAEMYTVRKTYEDKADKYVRLHGHLNFGQGGALLDMMHVLKNYGAVPQQSYEGLEIGFDYNKHGEMEAVLLGIIDAVIENKNGRISPVWKSSFNATLDAYLGEDPNEFEWNGKTYNPRSFADEVIGVNPDDYVQFTSFTHRPLHEEMVIEVPDNWLWAPAYNLSLDEMITSIDYALEEGFTISWAADVSEKGFSVKNGIALIPDRDWKDLSDEEKADLFNGPHPQLEVTPEIRQMEYDNYQTTDDHGMQITGLATDQEGNKFYIVKNSWGTKYGFDGYLYFSEEFVRLKTISYVVHKDGVPKDVAKAVNL